MDVENPLQVAPPRPLVVTEALWRRVCFVGPDDRPLLTELPDTTVFAVFERGPCPVFLGLVTPEQIAARPGRVFMDLLLQPPPPPLRPDDMVEAVWRRLQRERSGALAVLDDHGRFVGAVTPASLLDAVLRRLGSLEREIRLLGEGYQRRLDCLAEHAGRLRRLNDALRTMLSQALEEGQEADLFQNALEVLTSLVGARYGALVVLDGEGKVADFLYTGLSEAEAAAIGRLPRGEGLLGEPLSRQGILRLQDLAAHPGAAGFPPGHPPMNTLVAAVVRHEGEIYGRVYLCDREDGEPFSAEDEQLVKAFAEATGLAVFHRRNREVQRRAEVDLRIAAQVFESSAEGILITDADKRIVLVNQALTTITGYSREELIGKTPAVFSSGHHDKAFYAEMWRSLNETGQWQGEIWNRRKSGAVYPEWLRINAITDETGQVTHYVAVFADLSEFLVPRKGMERLMHFDHLTELPNRLTFRAELKQAMLRTRFNGKWMALLMVDLDRFKIINDTLGHQTGDRLLQQVARRLQHCLRRREAPRMGDTVARLSGDEFTIILNDLESREDAAVVVDKIMERFRQPFVLGELERSVTVSVGVAFYPGAAETLDDLISQADIAMYHAKRQGRNRWCIYDPDVHGPSQRRQVLENDLYNALDRRQFEIHYQPQVAMKDGRVIGLEALLRWNHPEHGTVSPAEFIPMLEETGLIVPVGEWVLRRVGADYRRCLRALGLREGALTVAVNVSPRQLGQELVGQVRRVLEEWRLDPAWLKLELTESVAMEDPEGSMRVFTALKELGVEICIDDFGTGYSSLSYLTRLPIAALKIDRSFIRSMSDHAEDREVVGAVIALGHNLGLQVVAEGVETQDQYDELAAMGCDVVQGYLCGRPVPLDRLRPPGATASPD